MATREEVGTLRWFRWSEFRHPERLDIRLLRWLDAVREAAGVPLHVTSDWREHVPPGGSARSLHRVGRAVDVRFPFGPGGRQDGRRLAQITRAVLTVPVPAGLGGVEYGIEATAPAGAHLHLGLYDDGRPDWLFTR